MGGVPKEDFCIYIRGTTTLGNDVSDAVAGEKAMVQGEHVRRFEDKLLEIKKINKAVNRVRGTDGVKKVEGKEREAELKLEENKVFFRKNKILK